MPPYTVDTIWKNVSKAEFEEYLRTYPRPLSRDVYWAVEPPSVSYNDFQLADLWPFSTVALTSLYDDNPDSFYYIPENERVYRIVTNFEECFASKPGKEES